MKVQIALAGSDSKAAVRSPVNFSIRLSKTAADADNSPALLAEIREKTYLARGSAQMMLRIFRPLVRISRMLALSPQTIQIPTTVSHPFQH